MCWYWTFFRSCRKESEIENNMSAENICREIVDRETKNYGDHWRLFNLSGQILRLESNYRKLFFGHEISVGLVQWWWLPLVIVWLNWFNWYASTLKKYVLVPAYCNWFNEMNKRGGCCAFMLKMWRCFAASGKIVLDKLTQETNATVLWNLTTIIEGLRMIRNDLSKVNELTGSLHDKSSRLDFGRCWTVWRKNMYCTKNNLIVEYRFEADRPENCSRYETV